MIDNLPDYIFVKDTEGRFLVSNIANARAIGAERPSQVVGKRNNDFYPPEIAARYDRDDQEVMATGKGVFQWEEEVFDPKTRHKRWYAITKIPMTNHSGEISGIVGMIRDITEAKMGEAELKIANERLAELNELKSHFLLKMSHELRTPLNSIMGYTQMLLQGLNGPLSERQEDRLQRVADNARNLLGMIDDILDLSKIQTNQLEIRVQPVALEQLFRETVLAFQAVAAQRSLELTTQIDAKLPLVHADAAALLKVMTHLVGNSLKFTRQGGVTLSARLLTAQEQAQQGLADRAVRWALVQVQDTGSGIPPEKLMTVFDEFRQVEDAPTRRHDGSGLGLAISYKLMKLMGGTIWLESEPGQGTTANLLLPCGASPAIEARSS